MDYTIYLPEDIGLCIFDLDGTLVDSMEDQAISINRVLESRGLPPLDAETVRRAVGNGARMLVRRALAAAAGKASVRAPGNGAYDEAYIDESLAAYRAHYDAHCADHAVLYPGMREWLDSLRARGCRLAVLTNKPERTTHLMLDRLGVSGCLDIIAGPETFGALKPDPAGIFAIMERTGVPKERTVMVGDSVVDVETGRRAGVLTCGILGGIGDESALRAYAPDILIER